MFKSIDFREPSGLLFELATDQPGFVFEPADRLGESLVLIGDLEDRRAELEQRFPLLPNPHAARGRGDISMSIDLQPAVRRDHGAGSGLGRELAIGFAKKGTASSERHESARTSTTSSKRPAVPPA